jgi:hypothetical protein
VWNTFGVVVLFVIVAAGMTYWIVISTALRL